MFGVKEYPHCDYNYKLGGKQYNASEVVITTKMNNKKFRATFTVETYILIRHAFFI